MNDIQKRAHLHCFACSRSNPNGMQLEYALSKKGDVIAEFKYGNQYEGFPGILHGGVLSAILDEAMTHCLFAGGYVAVTADYRVQFRHPVVTDQNATVRAWISYSTQPLYILQAEIVQNGRVKTIATGRFMEQPQLLSEESSRTIKEPTITVR